MAEVLVIKLDEPGGDKARWIVVDSAGSRLGAPVIGPLSAARIDAGERKVIVLVPSTDVLTTSVELPVKSAVRIQQALPFAMEELVADDLEDLHFAAGPRSEDGRIPVSVVNREILEGWLDVLGDAGLKPSALMAESYGLARIPGTISLMLAGETALVNDGADTMIAMQGLGPGDALEAIGALGGHVDDSDDGDDAGPLPRHVIVYCDAKNEQRHGTELSALRSEFDSFDIKILPDGDLPRLAVTVAAGGGVNLLQGRYGPKTEYAGYLRPWRYAAMLLLGLGVALVAEKAISNVKLDRQEAELRERFIAEYREIAPGADDVRDPAAVISSLRARTGTAGEAATSLFLQSLEQLGAAVQENSSADIEAISFRAGVVDVRITAPSVADLDNIQRKIDAGGEFEADIQSTDQAEDKVNSRIQIRAAGS